MGLWVTRIFWGCLINKKLGSAEVIVKILNAASEVVTIEDAELLKERPNNFS